MADVLVHGTVRPGRVTDEQFYREWGFVVPPLDRPFTKLCSTAETWGGAHRRMERLFARFGACRRHAGDRRMPTWYHYEKFGQCGHRRRFPKKRGRYRV